MSARWNLKGRKRAQWHGHSNLYKFTHTWGRTLNIILFTTLIPKQWDKLKAAWIAPSRQYHAERHINITKSFRAFRGMWSSREPCHQAQRQRTPKMEWQEPWCSIGTGGGLAGTQDQETKQSPEVPLPVLETVTSVLMATVIPQQATVILQNVPQAQFLSLHLHCPYPAPSCHHLLPGILKPDFLSSAPVPTHGSGSQEEKGVLETI